MSIIHIAFYPSDWLAGTRGMSDAETGVYITLIAKMYEMAGPIERDDERLYRSCGCKSKASFLKSLNYLISVGKVIEVEDGLFNERASKVIKETIEKSAKAQSAAQSRWDRKPNKNKRGTDANASAEHMPEACQSKSESELYKRDTNVSPKKRAARLPENWVLSKACGEWAVGEGYSIEAIRIEAEKFKDYWIGVGGTKGTKLDWPATWRNWIRNSKQGSNNGNGNSNSKRRDPALEQIARLTGLSTTPGDGGL